MARITEADLQKYKRKKYDIIVGIDPDADKNGVARLTVATHKMDVTTLRFSDTLDFLRSEQRRCEVSGQNLVVIVEAGWLNRSNWHLNGADTRASACAKGISVGRNQEVGRKLIEMCEHWQIYVEAIKPLRKCWKGHDRKITQAELEGLTGQKIGRTNQEGRDAALISWVWSGLTSSKNHVYLVEGQRKKQDNKTHTSCIFSY